MPFLSSPVLSHWCRRDRNLDGWRYGNYMVLGRVSPERKHYEPYEVPEETEVSKNAE